MNDSCKPSLRARPDNDDHWITFAHPLDLPDVPGLISDPPRIPMDDMLDYCEEWLAKRGFEAVLAQPDRQKGPLEFIL